MPPDLLPVLAKGKHRNPRRGACFMEFASLLAGERWSDHPECTHPVLAAIARAVNDYTTDENRPRLAALVPEVIGTATEEPHVAPELVSLCCRTAIPHADGRARFVLAVGLLSAQRQLAHLAGREPDEAERREAESLLSSRELATARHFMRGMRTSRRYYQRKGAQKAAEYAVVSMGMPSGPATDDKLRDLLTEAAALCRTRVPEPPVSSAAEAWAQACAVIGVAPSG
jgi:hypothetical protein